MFSTLLFFVLHVTMRDYLQVSNSVIERMLVAVFEKE